MRDYAELVKALRYCSEHDDCGSRCPFFSSTTVCADERAKEAADAIEELLAAVPKWISVEERLPKRTNPLHARDTYLVRLESGCIKTLFYEYDNSDRCRPGMSPLFSEGWEKTAVPVTHWMPLPEAPKEERTDDDA